jgi:hypothetical protein
MENAPFTLIITNAGTINIYYGSTISPDLLTLLAEAVATPTGTEPQERTPHSAGTPDAADGEG